LHYSIIGSLDVQQKFTIVPLS